MNRRFSHASNVFIANIHAHAQKSNVQEKYDRWRGRIIFTHQKMKDKSSKSHQYKVIANTDLKTRNEKRIDI